MTAPDHTPYLAATDLRTALDAADWLDKRIPRPHRIEDAVRYAVDDLRAQIDRERRQACRRGALEATRTIARQKLWLRFDYAQSKGAERFGTFAKCMAHQREMRWGSYLRRALAFRAAARQP